MKNCRIIILSWAAAFAIGELWACCPVFPTSYFPCDEEGRFEYALEPCIGAELTMIGERYYPGWFGRSPKSNGIPDSKADMLDFLSAAENASIPKARAEMEYSRFHEFAESVCTRIESGENVEIPAGVPDYAREFYLYKLGHAQWLVFRRDEDPQPFQELLALPENRRRYRTTWVHYVRIANARTPAEKDRHIADFRRVLDGGFKDTASLEAYLPRFLFATRGTRYAPLVLAAYARTPWNEWPNYAKRIFIGQHGAKLDSAEWIKKMCADPVGTEIVIALGKGDMIPEDVTIPSRPALAADRRAWIEFSHGRITACRKLLAMAPEKSLIRLFLEARLARMDGDIATSAEKLHSWLAEYTRRAGTGEALPVGYCIELWSGEWYTGLRESGLWHSCTVHLYGKYGPSGLFHECLYGEGSSAGELKEQSAMPTMRRVVAGELGVVNVAGADFEEALYAFILARNWIDIAFVAERCMKVDELATFVKRGRFDKEYRDKLRGLLMRRLMRCGRIAEALECAPPALKPVCREFAELHAIATDAKRNKDERAVAYFNLSRLTAVRGMELMGTELRPDVSVFDGDYAYDAEYVFASRGYF